MDRVIPTLNGKTRMIHAQSLRVSCYRGPEPTLTTGPEKSRWDYLRIGMLGALMLALVFAPRPLAAGNPYPIVLVHGFIGWGPEEMSGYHYWGGRDDIVQMLRDAGHATHAGVVGPLASNWDRACELYAYIKGGTVDYGTAHARKFGHRRFGRTFPGLLPDWGDPGDHAQVHLVGHSQGGQTIRVLSSLLALGDEAEREAAGAAQPHLLFRGGHRWVFSATSLAAPHDGTTLATLLQGEAPYLLSWLLALTSYIGQHFEEAPSYDFKLDQWDIQRHAEETDEAYRLRVVQNPIWTQKDISVWGPAAGRRHAPEPPLPRGTLGLSLQLVCPGLDSGSSGQGLPARTGYESGFDLALSGDEQLQKPAAGREAARLQ